MFTCLRVQAYTIYIEWIYLNVYHKYVRSYVTLVCMQIYKHSQQLIFSCVEFTPSATCLERPLCPICSISFLFLNKKKKIQIWDSTF